MGRPAQRLAFSVLVRCPCCLIVQLQISMGYVLGLGGPVTGCTRVPLAGQREMGRLRGGFTPCSCVALVHRRVFNALPHQHCAVGGAGACTPRLSPLDSPCLVSLVKRKNPIATAPRTLGTVVHSSPLPAIACLPACLPATPCLCRVQVRRKKEALPKAKGFGSK